MSSMSWVLADNTNVSLEDVRNKYRIDEADQTIFYSRPTLRKSPWLYLVLAIQPLLIFIILGLIVMLHSEPLSRGFGLVSILSGIDRQSLNNLAGASLSGDLSRIVRRHHRRGRTVMGSWKGTSCITETLESCVGHVEKEEIASLKLEVAVTKA
ncbi:hypothetical protein BDP81DRAFT_447858 [Colletotrichum phormii]|uniref:Uncharacterized protein n=1 Tax=Colletotrichum phormii TaxID=359342 RepID=A0AAJ0EJI0_9PEZI|nr:uncharacterized protein BDP81DRAFT_447858 [Colletotrichum phormii]KAK1638965.1 hypothetical protein BDP81DRAFT_447858 [Colletotrichum phormii]